MRYFSLAMSALYFALGILFLFTDVLQDRIPTYRIPLGLVLLTYGIGRAWIWKRKYAQEQSNNA